MLVNPVKKENKQEKINNQVFEIQDITRLIEAAHNNIKNCQEELGNGYSKEKEKKFVTKAQHIHEKLYSKNIQTYEVEKKINKKQRLIVWANDLLAGRGYRMFEMITANFKSCQASHE